MYRMNIENVKQNVFIKTKTDKENNGMHKCIYVLCMQTVYINIYI